MKRIPSVFHWSISNLCALYQFTHAQMKAGTHEEDILRIIQRYPAAHSHCLSYIRRHATLGIVDFKNGDPGKREGVSLF